MPWPLQLVCCAQPRPCIATSPLQLVSPLVHERDLYLAWSLKRSKAVNGARSVVGVVGKGHLRGVCYALTHDAGETGDGGRGRPASRVFHRVPCGSCGAGAERRALLGAPRRSASIAPCSWCAPALPRPGGRQEREGGPGATARGSSRPFCPGDGGAGGGLVGLDRAGTGALMGSHRMDGSACLRMSALVRPPAGAYRPCFASGHWWHFICAV